MSVPAAQGTRPPSRRLFSQSSFLERWREKRQIFREEGALAFPAAPRRQKGGRVTSHRHCVLLTRRDERSAGAWQPRAQEGVKVSPWEEPREAPLLMRTPAVRAEGRAARLGGG